MNAQANKLSAEAINAHLRSGGSVQLSTATRSWLYRKAWAGYFYEANGCLFLRKGTRSECLSMSNGSLLVSLRLL